MRTPLAGLPLCMEPSYTAEKLGAEGGSDLDWGGATQVFKRHMDDLLAPLFGSLGCEHQLCRAAAGRCIGQLRDFVGPGIWAGHLTDDQAAAMARSPDIPAPAGDTARQKHFLRDSL